MATTLEELEKQARALTPNEKAALAHRLIEQLDASSDADAKRLWVELAQQKKNGVRLDFRPVAFTMSDWARASRACCTGRATAQGTEHAGVKLNLTPFSGPIFPEQRA
jgi:hypothetical protein